MKKNLITVIVLLFAFQLFSATWEKVCTGAPFQSVLINSMSEVSGGKLYLGSWGNDSGVFRIDVGAGAPVYTSLFAKRDFMNLKIDPNNADALFGAHWDTKLYKMTGVTGGTFAYTSAAGNTLSSSASAHHVEVDRTNSQRVILATYEGLFRSSNGGTSMEKVISGEGFLNIKQSPWNTDEFYAVGANWNNSSGRGGVYKYTWSTDILQYMGLVNTNTRWIAFDLDNPGNFYILDRGDAKVFYFNGTTFTAKADLPNETTDARQILFTNSCGSGVLYAGGGNAKAYVSTDGAASWQPFFDGLPVGVMTLAEDKVNGYLYAGTTAGLYRVLICGTPTATRTATSMPSPTATITPIPTPAGTWEKVCTSAPFQSVLINSMSEAKYGKLYLGTWGNDSGVFRIDISAGAPVYTSLFAKRDFMNLKVDPNNSDIMLGAHWDTKLYKMNGITGGAFTYTMAAGNTVSSSASAHHIEIDRTNSQRVILATYEGLFRSSNGGTSMEKVISGEGFLNIEQSPWNADEFYAVGANWNNSSGRGGVYKYTWSSDTLQYMGLVNTNTRWITFDLDNPGNFYILDRGDPKVFYYNGSTFVAKADLPNETTDARQILFTNCSGAPVLYAGGGNAKAYISLDGAVSWQPFYSGLNAGVMTFAEDKEFGYLYAGTIAGLYRVKICSGTGAENTPTPVTQPTTVPSNTPTQVIPPTAVPTVATTPEPTPAITVTDDDTDAYPNPCSDHVKVVFNINKKSDIKIYVYSFNGKLVDTVDYSIGWTPNQKLYQINLDVKKYAPGMYFYTIQGKSEDGEIINYKSKKFLIKR